jgi:hypothetical protein
MRGATGLERDEDIRATDDTILVLKQLHQAGMIPGPLLLCLMTGDSSVPCCEPMLRIPAPATGHVFDIGFDVIFRAALERNPSIHDGAVLIRRRTASDAYRIDGWSYRLMAPLPVGRAIRPNRGSAYNSCLAFSYQPGVDSVYLLSRGLLTEFKDGSEAMITNF